MVPETHLTVEPVRHSNNARIRRRKPYRKRIRQAAGELLAIAGLHRNALAPFGATTRKYRLTALGLHAAAETVLLGTSAAVGLECALGHGKTALL